MVSFVNESASPSSLQHTKFPDLTNEHHKKRIGERRLPDEIKRRVIFLENEGRRTDEWREKRC